MAIITPDSDEFKNVMANLSKKDNLSKDTTVTSLDKINQTLNKILEAIKGGSNVTPKNRPKSNDDDEEMTGLDKLKFIFGGVKSLGKGVKESVKSTFFTKPDAAPVMSSAEALEAKDTLNQPKQVEVDQLKVAEETKDTQKEILKELKKLNETTEDKSSGGGGSSSLPDLPGKLGKAGKASTIGKAAGAGSKLGMGAMGGVAAGAAAVGLIGGLTYLGFRKDSQIAETKDEAAVKKAEMDQKLSSGAASIEEAAGSGLSKEDEMFQSTFLSPKKTSTEASQTTPASTPSAPITSAASTPSAAPATTKVGGAISASASKPSPSKKSSVQQEMEGDDNLEKLEMAQAELQGLQEDYRDEKRKVTQELLRSGKYPEGFSDFKGKPNYPEELKAVDQKYEPLINAQKKEIEKLSKAPGVKEAKARGDSFDKEMDGETSDVKNKDTLSKASPKETFSKTTTSTDTTTTGGGSTTTKRVRSADAEAAQKEMTALEGKHEEEKQQVVSKLKAEGKVGKVVKFSDYENVPELKELTTKQEQERASISARIDAGTTTEVSRTSGENVSLRDEITTTRGTPTPIVSNNVTNTSTNNYVPIKTDPRPNSRGSALDNYVGRITSY